MRDEKRMSHTVTGKEKHCNPKKQLPSFAVLWQPQNLKHHIKREKTKYQATTDFLIYVKEKKMWGGFLG